MANQSTSVVTTVTPADTNYNLFVFADGFDAHIPELFVTNQDGSNAAVASVALCADGVTAAVGYDIIKADSVAAGVGERMLTGAGLIVPNGYKLRVKCGSANDLTFTAVVKKTSPWAL